MKIHYFAALVMLIFATSCTKNDKQELIGTWKYIDKEQSETYSFSFKPNDLALFELTTATSRKTFEVVYYNVTPNIIYYSNSESYNGAIYNFISDKSMSWLDCYVFTKKDGYGLNGIYYKVAKYENEYIHYKLVFSKDSLVVYDVTTNSPNYPQDDLFEVLSRNMIKSNLKEYMEYENNKLDKTYEYRIVNENLYFGEKKKRKTLVKE